MVYPRLRFRRGAQAEKGGAFKAVGRREAETGRRERGRGCWGMAMRNGEGQTGVLYQSVVEETRVVGDVFVVEGESQAGVKNKR